MSELIESKLSRFREILNAIWRVIALLCGIALILYGGLLLLGQLFFWLRFGSWLELPFTSLFHHPLRGYGEPFPLSIVPDLGAPKVVSPATPWVGMQKILNWLFDVSLVIWSVFLGAAVIAFGNIETDQSTTRK